MQLDRLRLIGDECPAYAGDFAMTQATARAVLERDIDRDAACKRTASELADTQRELDKARWWDDNGPIAVIGGVTFGILVGGVTGFLLGDRIR